MVTLCNDTSSANKFYSACNDSSFQGARSVPRESAVTSSLSLDSSTAFLVPSSSSFFSQFLIKPLGDSRERLRFLSASQVSLVRP